MRAFSDRSGLFAFGLVLTGSLLATLGFSSRWCGKATPATPSPLRDAVVPRPETPLVWTLAGFACTGIGMAILLARPRRFPGLGGLRRC